MNKEPVYYRKTEIKDFKDFKDGDYVCEVCNGWGYFYDCEDNKVSQCYHCKGKGKLDWITNVTGVAKPLTTGVGSSSYGYGGGTSGHAKIPPPPPKRISGGKSLKYKAIFHETLKKETIPQKKISLRQKIMNVVADK